MTVQDLLQITCRAARRSDKADMLDLTREIWEGHDYVPDVWDEWLEDPQGLLAVAEHQKRVLGLCKLTRLGECDWWLEGIRVHPSFQGFGIASQLHDYILNYWQQIGNGKLRLGTSSKRLPIHHLCTRTGFKRILELAWVAAPADPTPLSEGRFQPIQKHEISEAITLAQRSQTLALTAGLMDFFWRWAPPAEEHLAKDITLGNAWWWRGGKGLLVIDIDHEEDEPTTSYIKMLACKLEETLPCLQDYRRLAAQQNCTVAGWRAPVQPEFMEILNQAGFQLDEDHSLYFFEKEWGR